MKRTLKRPVLAAAQFPYYAVWFTLVYFYFINLFENYIDSGLVGRIYVGIVFVTLAFYIILNKRLPRIKIHIPWLLFMAVVVNASQWAIKNNNLYWVTMFVTLICMLFVLPSSHQWVEKLWPTLISIGMIHVIATILFFIFPASLYNSIMLPVWGHRPGGVSLAEAYKAGLCNHYTTNGIYCGAVCLILGAKIIVDPNPKSRKKDIVFLIIALFALLLTTKRGPLLFSLLALVVTYYICNPKNGVSKGFYITLAATIAMILFYMLAPFLPLFGDILSRFADTDDISNNRFLFWEQAYELFLTNKIWGIGWGAYIKKNWYGTCAHNIYIQLLCETGIVGLCVFLTAMISTYATAVRDFKKHGKGMSSQQKYILGGAIAVQTFIIAYGFTGNCLYDMTVFFYFLSCAASLTMHQVLNPKKVKNQRLM